MFFWLLAALGFFVVKTAKKPAELSSPATSALPWSPPVSVLPVKTKSGSTDLTPFPLDVWVWTVPVGTTGESNQYVLAVATDDPTSFVGYSVSGPNKQKILGAKGPGPLSSQIQAQM